jgi:ferric-dicitrate binding protein FerR (iron transport regulator)
MVPVLVTRGEEITYGSDGHASAVRQTDPLEILGWRQGVFRFTHAPLREIIANLQRHLSVSRRITLDPSTAELLYTGTVRQEDFDAWIHNLPLVFPVQVVDSGPNSILIRLRP